MGADTDRHLAQLETWLRSYRPEELFNADGTPVELVASFPPAGSRRMGANPHANGGLLLRDLRTPDFRDYAVDVKSPGSVEAQDMYVLGTYVRDVMKLNMDARNFRIFAPDETASNRLQAVFDVTGRRFLDQQIPGIDDHLDPDGRVMDSMLSEHFCEGFLEGYLLTGRHGFFDSYEAFIRIVDSMFAQHAKWLKMCSELPWRHDIASLNYILASNVWQQDHNGFTHQDPGFLDHVANKKADVVRMYLPPDANCLLSCFDHCIKSRNYVNVIVASKHPRQQWLTMEQAVKHCTQGIGIWSWASNDQGEEPDVVMACCGDTPTLETLAAVSILRKELPELPKVPRMGLLLRHGTREEQETPETEPVPEETPAAEEISPAPAEETPVTKAPAAPEPEAYSVDEILREVHGGAPQADNAPTPAAPVYSGARVLERLLDDPEKLASDLDALTRAIQGLSDDLRRGAAESREGQVDR